MTPLELRAVRYFLPSRRICELSAPEVPGVPHYLVLAPREAEAGGSSAGSDVSTERADAELAQLVALAAEVAARVARRRFGDAGCFTLLASGARARRRPWPHVHIVLAESVAAKRRALLWLSLKHVTRPALALGRTLRASLERTLAKMS
jgi:hypothetical protein